MAKGYPDYFGYSVFPQYGTPNFTTFIFLNIIPAATQECFEILSKGSIRTGYIRLKSAADFFATVHVKVWIDSILLFDNDPWDEYWSGQDQSVSSVVTLSRLGLTGGAYYVDFIFNTDWTFAHQVKVAVVNNSAANIDTWGNFIYAKVA